MSEHCCHSESKPFYQETLWIINFFCFALICLTYFFDTYKGLFNYFLSFSLTLLLPVLLGLIIGGIIDTYIPNTYVEKILARPKKRTLLYALFMGTLLSTCSHGVLAIAIQLHKKGASTSSIIALLTAAPWANFTITILMLKFFQLKGLLIIVLSMVIAVILGLIFQVLERYNLVEKSKTSANNNDEFSIRSDIQTRWKQYQFSLQQSKKEIQQIYKSAASLARMVLSWMVLAIFMATVIQFFVPAHIFQHYFSSSFLGMINTLVAATLLEVCSEGTSILSFELYQHNQAFGNVILFLFAGVITDYTEIGLLWKNVGKRTAIALPLIGSPIIFLVAYLTNIFM